MKYTSKTVNDQSNHNGGTMTTPSFNTILNPSTGKMVLSGGRVGSKLIKNYTADTILNPKSNKLVMTGGKVGKNVLETYKNGYLKGGGNTSDNLKNTDCTLIEDDMALKRFIYEAFMSEHKESFNKNSYTLLGYHGTVKVNRGNEFEVSTGDFKASIYNINTDPTRQRNFLNFLKKMFQCSENYKLQKLDAYTKIITPIVTYFSDKTEHEGKTFAEIFGEYRITSYLQRKKLTGFQELDVNFFKNLDILIQEIRLEDEELKRNNIIEWGINNIQTFKPAGRLNTIEKLNEEIYDRPNMLSNKVWAITNSDSQKLEWTDVNTRLNIIQQKVMDNYNAKIVKHLQWLITEPTESIPKSTLILKKELKEKYIKKWDNMITVANNRIKENTNSEQIEKLKKTRDTYEAQLAILKPPPPVAQGPQAPSTPVQQGGKKKRTYKKIKN
jgi:hypothetical protein